MNTLEQTLQDRIQDAQNTSLDDAQLQAFAAELNRLKAEFMDKIGDEDVAYVEMVYQMSRIFEISGRLLIHFSLEPVSWSLGVLSLWVHLQLDNLELNHSAQHQAWDHLPAARRFHSDRYVHNSFVDEEAWRYRHNILHHSYTGQIERDPDITFGFFRLSELIDKQYFHKVQPLMLVLNTLGAGDNTGLVSSGLLDYVTRLLPGYKAQNYPPVYPLSPENFLKSLSLFSRKAVPNFLYNYGLFGFLAGPLFWPKVTLGTLSAQLLRNIFTGLSFYTGHMVEGVKHYTEPPGSRAAWYIQQIEGTGNVRAGKFVSMLMGHLNYQIEHHLFPKLPPNRYEEIAPQVEALCREYGVQYISGSFSEQVRSVFRQIQRFAR